MEFLKLLVSPVGLAMVCVVCATLIGLGILNYRVKVGKDGASMERGGSGDKKRLGPHANCSKRVSGVDALRRTMEFTDHREELRQSILGSQMDFYEEKEEEAKSILKKAFGALLKEKYNIEDFSSHKAYSDFNKTLYIAFGNMKKSVRKWFKNNHYDKLGTNEQLNYITAKREIMLDKISEELTFNWFQEDITRKEFSASVKDSQEDFEKLINMIFSRAFSIARETHAKIRMLEVNYERYVKDTFGDDAEVLIRRDDDLGE